MRFTLGAYLRARRDGVRHRLEHLETLPDDLVAAIPRRRRDRLDAARPPRALRRDGDGNWNERLGPERAARAFRMRDLLDAGAVLALGSDWPVADADPRLGLAAARLRRLPHARELPCSRSGADRPGGARGLHARARAAAGEEGVAGRIRVGMRADLTGLAVDPVDAPAAELPDNPVWLTVVGGRVVYRKRS